MRKPRFSWPALFAAAVLILLRGVPAWAEPAAAPSANEAAALDPAGLLLFSVTLDGLTLSEGIGAYGAPDDPLVPVGELTRLLEADVDVLAGDRRIVGRVGAARRTLLVDLRAGIARVAAQEVALAGEDSAVTATEIYLRVSALRKLLPLKVEVAGEELTLRLTATEPFPVQARLQRLANRPDGSQVVGAEDEALRVVEPYAFFSPPGLDVVLDGGFQSGPRSRPFRYDLRMAGDLLWANFQGFVGSDESGRATTARLMLQRRSLEGNLLGPLHAREITAGDTFTPGLPMGPRSIAGRGVSFSTAPLEQTNIFNQIDLRGELPPGFDVELYVNDVLKGGTNQAVNGRYEFLDVPLAPGVNVLRVVTYGPRGERQEEVQVVNVGVSLLRPGEATFAFGAVEQDTPLLRLRRVDGLILGDPGLYASGGLRMVGAVNFGISELVTGSAGAARIPRPDGGTLGVYTLGARTSLFGVATQFDAAWDGRGGSGTVLGLAGQFRDISAVLRHGEYRDGFVDENNIGFNAQLDLDRRTELTLDTNVSLRGRIIPVSLRAVRNEYEDRSIEVAGAARASTSLGGMLVSAGLEYQRQAFRPARPVETLTGYLAASTYRSPRWQLRATLDYDIVPDFRARFLAVSVDRRLSELWSLRFGLGQPLDDLDGWNLVVSSIYATRVGDLALTGEYDNRDDSWRLAAQWAFGLGWNPGRGYRLGRTGPGSSGSVLFNAFIDENGDGVRQAAEPAAPDVVVAGGGQREAVTGPDGRVLITGLGSSPRARMDVSLERLENPSVQTPPSRLEVRPRPGGVARVDYPMRPTGEVLVKVELLRDDGRRVGLSSVRLQLAPETGSPAEAVTEFDGSAMFASLPRGTYRLQLEPSQAERLRMRLLDAPAIVIKGDGGFTPDVVVQVRFQPPASETTVARAGGGDAR